MPANVDIVNRALSKLGENRIMSMDDPGEKAGLASSLFGVVRDAEIAAHSWNFAKTRAQITAEGDAPSFGWRWQYLLPPECLRVLVVGNWPQPVMSDEIGEDSGAYALEGGRILTNTGPVLRLKYLQRVADTNLFPAAFVEALACKLAVEMCERLVASNSKREMAWNEYEQAVRLAKRINAISLPPVRIEDDTWMVAHRMGVL